MSLISSSLWTTETESKPMIKSELTQTQNRNRGEIPKLELSVWKIPKHVFAQYLCAFGLKLTDNHGHSLKIADMRRPANSPTQSKELIYELVVHPWIERPAETVVFTLRMKTIGENGEPTDAPLGYSRFNSHQYY